MNTAPNLEVYPSLNLKEYQATISVPAQWTGDLVNLLMIDIIRSATMKNTYHLTVWLKRCPDAAIAKHFYLQPQGSSSIFHLDHVRTGGKLI